MTDPNWRPCPGSCGADTVDGRWCHWCVESERPIAAEREARAEILTLKARVAELEGDRCDVCDADGLIYVPLTGAENSEEEAQVCSACEGTRSGVTTRVVKECDEARAEVDEVAKAARTVGEALDELKKRAEAEKQMQIKEAG